MTNSLVWVLLIVVFLLGIIIGSAEATIIWRRSSFQWHYIQVCRAMKDVAVEVRELLEEVRALRKEIRK